MNWAIGGTVVYLVVGFFIFVLAEGVWNGLGHSEGLAFHIRALFKVTLFWPIFITFLVGQSMGEASKEDDEAAEFVKGHREATVRLLRENRHD